MNFKIIQLAIVFSFLFACGPASESTDQKQDSGADRTKDPAYQKGLQLVSSNDCLTCHQIADKAIGPSYKDIAQKYASATDEALSAVAQKIIKGGSGVWGQVPMTPHPALSTQDAESIVQYILLLK